MGIKKRMFSAEVLRSADFMYLSKEAQILYMNLCLEADDRGAVEIAPIVVSMLGYIGVEKTHLTELIDSGLVIQLEERLHIIADWYVQNQIQAKVFHESKHKEKIKQNLGLNEIDRYVFVGSPDMVKPVPEYERNAQDGGESAEKVRQIGGKMAAKMTPKRRQIGGENDAKSAEKARQNGGENTPQYSIDKYSIDKVSIDKVSIDQNNNTHTTQGSENTETVCADVCVHDESCDQTSCSCQTNTPSDIPDPPSNPPESLTADPPDDFDYSPDDDIDDAFEHSKELTAKAEDIRKRLKAAGLGVPDEITWYGGDFRYALEGKRRMRLSDENFFGALENYAVFLEAKRANPAAYWWKSKPPVSSLFKDDGSGPAINWFLPGAFDLNNLKKGGGDASAPSRRGVDSVRYDASEIAERQAAAMPVYDDASYDDLPY